MRVCESGPTDVSLRLSKSLAEALLSRLDEPFAFFGRILLTQISIPTAEPLRATVAATGANGVLAPLKEWRVTMENLLQDLRYAVRLLSRHPAFTAVVIISLGLAIGANTAIFSLVNAALLRPLPVEQPEQLRRMFMSYTSGLRYGAFSYRDYLYYRDENKVLSGLAAHRLAVFGLSHGSETETIQGMIVSGNYFSVLGIRPVVGRSFLPQEDLVPDSHPVAVISHGLWNRRFNSDPNIVGKSLIINGRNFSVVGVAPKDFTGTELGYAPEVYVPIMMQSVVRPGSNLADQDARWLYLIGRLKPGISEQLAVGSVRVLTQQLAQASTTTRLKGVTVVVAPATASHPEMRKAFVPLAILLLVVVGLVLLMACTNVANLLLARASARRREIGIRLAMGATRWRLIRQLLTESLLLSLLGSALGLLLAFWTSDLLLAFTPPTDIRVVLDLTLDYRVLLFTLVMALLAGVLFGIIPARQATNPHLARVLKKDDDSSYGYRKSRLRSALIVIQTMLSLVLLICAGLFLKSLKNAQTLDPGFDKDNILLMSLNMDLHAYDEAKAQVFYDRLLENIRGLPGVKSASLAEKVFGDDQQRDVVVEGYSPLPNTDMLIDYNIVESDYLQVMGIPLTRGRDFTSRDMKTSPGVVIINEQMARRFWPDQDPIGKRISISGIKGPYLEVVGVAKVAKYYDLQERLLSYMYLPYKQNYESRATLHVRTMGDPNTLIGAVKQQVQALDRNLPVFGISTMTDHMNKSLWLSRMAATLLAIFGALALALVTVGVYGVVTYYVTQRTNEIAIRLALGAKPSNVLWLLLGQSVRLAFIGLGFGLGLACAFARFTSSLLYGVSTYDPIIFGGITLLIVVVTLLASYIPARRVMRIDPVVTLRYE
jgi:macrolide transport system ATP-binding/permease protein